jgi:glycosyltransferase involved in cell wall biosynthesis
MSFDVLCFSHLRWNFVYQRPQHLLSRFAKHSRVFMIEEPVFGNSAGHFELSQVPDTQLWIVTPHLTLSDAETITKVQKKLLDLLIRSMNIQDYIAWYYSPMALRFSEHLNPHAIIYDCMDELSAFKFAPPALKQYEALLMQKADVVFTGGHHLYEAKKHLHHNIYPFPSSIDKEHFAQARKQIHDPQDQSTIPHPRIGFYGVVDERFNVELVKELASMRPLWHFVIIGPVVKIDESTLPKADNIHYLGSKDYKELPQYLAGWDIAMMPFALNESTKYISPTKTPEYLAGGKPVVSTSIRDVVIPYAANGLVQIADTADEFSNAIEFLLATKNDPAWLKKVDTFLADLSWDITWQQMQNVIDQAIEKKFKAVTIKKEKAYV